MPSTSNRCDTIFCGETRNKCSTEKACLWFEIQQIFHVSFLQTAHFFHVSTLVRKNYKKSDWRFQLSLQSFIWNENVFGEISNILFVHFDLTSTALVWRNFSSFKWAEALVFNRTRQKHNRTSLSGACFSSMCRNHRTYLRETKKFPRDCKNRSGDENENSYNTFANVFCTKRQKNTHSELIFPHPGRNSIKKPLHGECKS